MIRFNENYNGGGGNLENYAMKYLQIVKKYVSSGKLIDVGSSNSPFPMLAAKNDFNVTSADISNPSIMSTNIKYIKGDLNDINKMRSNFNKYNIVTSWAVIEHVPNPEIACSILSQLCNPGGYLFISTPEIGTILTKNIFGATPWFSPPMHLHIISSDALCGIFKKNGLELIKSGRLEITAFRYILRYSMGLLESIAGLCIRTFFPHLWLDGKSNKRQKFVGISYLIFRKLP